MGADLIRTSSIMFQSTPSRRGRRFLPVSDDMSEVFQSTPSRRGRRIRIVLYPPIHTFQSTPSRRGRPISCVSSHTGNAVSIHSLTQRETMRYSHDRNSDTFQSTPSRRGRHRKVIYFWERGCFNPLPHAEGDLRYAPNNTT